MTIAKSPITTHVLDLAVGRPAAGVPVSLAQGSGDDFREIGVGTTDADGRLTTWLTPGSIAPGIYRLRFDLVAYFARDGRTFFYPYVDIAFMVRAADEHYHVPLLLSPFGYSTYRGS